jgi:hypothetical protein
VEKKATEALLERNEIGRDQVEALDRIASALEANLQEMRDEDDDCDD